MHLLKPTLVNTQLATQGPDGLRFIGVLLCLLDPPERRRGGSG